MVSPLFCVPPAICHKSLIYLTTPAGFEPATFSLEGCCSSDPGRTHMKRSLEAFFSDLVAGPASH